MASELINSPLTDEQKGQICGILSVGCDRETAANFVGCSTAEIGRAMRQDPAFAAHVRRTEAGSELSHMRTVQDAAKEAKNWRASVWWLERHSPERFGPRGAGQVTVRQLDEFLQTLVEIVCDEIESEEGQRRMIKRMNDVIRVLDERVRATVPALSATRSEQVSTPWAGALDDVMADALDESEEDF
jgi:hypothetical protein